MGIRENNGGRMNIGDLVQHRGCGSYGIVTEIRQTINGDTAMAAIYWYTQDCVMLHTTRQLEVIDENQV